MADSAVVLPVVPLRSFVLFPKIPQPLSVTRARNLAALGDALKKGGEVLAVCQRDQHTDNPHQEDLYEVGVIATLQELPIDEETGSRRFELTGLSRARIVSFVQTAPYDVAEAVPIDEASEEGIPSAELISSLRARFLEYAATDAAISNEAKTAVSSEGAAPSTLVDYIATLLRVEPAIKQSLLEETDIEHRAKRVLGLLDDEAEKGELRQAIQTRVRRQLDQSQREYYLREQIKAIQAELGYDQAAERPAGIMPIFTSRVSRIDPNLCFVLMPFREPWSDRLYFKLIRPIVEALGLQCIRADNLTGQIIIEDIWTKINQCALIIADVTGRNANVMYELGIVHTIGKPTILITQEIDHIPFDFGHLRHYAYQDNIDGFKALSDTLREVAIQVFKNRYGIDLTANA
jgi:Lon protease-like protein